MTDKGTLMVAIYALPMLLVGTYWAISVVRKKRWGKATATIVSAQILGERTRTYKGFSAVEKQCDLTYTYLVNGKEYRSNKYFHTQVDANEIWFTEQFAKEVLNSYPVGKNIEVHYDRNNPGHSFIKFYEQRIGFLLILGGLLIAITVWYVKENLR